VKIDIPYLRVTESDPDTGSDASPLKDSVLGELGWIRETGEAGSAFEILVLEEGLSLNGNLYERGVLEESAATFEGAGVYAYEVAGGLLDHLDPEKKSRVGEGGGSPRNLVGALEGVHYANKEGKRGLFATLKVIPSWARELFRGVVETGKRHLLGFSIDALAQSEPLSSSTRRIKKFAPHPTLDVVSHPAAGGELMRLVASITGGDASSTDHQETGMDLAKFTTALTALLEGSKLPGAAVTKLNESMRLRAVPLADKGDQLEALLESAKTEIAAELAYVKSVAPKGKPEANDKPAQESGVDARRAVAVAMECREAMGDKLTESKLPEAAKIKIRQRIPQALTQFAKVAEAVTWIEAELKDEADYLAELGGPDVTGAGATREGANIETTADQRDKWQAAMEGMFLGRDVKVADKAVPRFVSLHEAFAATTGKHVGSDVHPRELMHAIARYQHAQEYGAWGSKARESVGAIGAGFRVVESSKLMRLGFASVKEAILTTTFGQMLGDSIARVARAEYALPDLQGWRKVASVANVKDFRTQRRPFTGSYGVLTVVNEQDNYPYATTPGDDEETYTIQKRGIRERLTIETVSNDDMSVISKIPGKLGRAAAETLYRAVFDTFTTNPNMYDGVTLFHANHNNTNAVALTAENLRLARVAMMSQVAYGSPNDAAGNGIEILGLKAAPRTLLVPFHLEELAWQLTHSPATLRAPVGGADVNASTVPGAPWNMEIEPLVVRHWGTVAAQQNDWYLLADPMNVPTLEVGFWNGREEPEIFVADDPLAGAMWSSDIQEFKVRQTYGVKWLDWRGTYQNNP